MSGTLKKRQGGRRKRRKMAGVNLYLVGFMATGKSTAGRAIARRFGYQFFDSDLEIEKKQGRSIPEIFEIEGEAAFRGYEREFIESGHPNRESVVSCGGGLVTIPGMIELLQSRGVVICLCATVETIYERSRRNSDRPLLNVEDPMGEIRRLMEKREEFYRRAGTMVLTDNRGLTDVLNHLQRVYIREAKEFLRRKGGAGGAE